MANGYYNPWKAASGIVDAKTKWTNAAAKGEDTSAYEKEAVKYYDELRASGRGDVADKLQKSDLVQANDYLKTLTPHYEATADGNQQKSNDVYKVGKDYGAEIAKSYDTVYQNNINVNPVDTGYGKAVMQSYGAAADGAYAKTLGAGIADAGGNADSYAAANANRQKAAMLSKGHGDILNYYNAISGRANEWAGSKASALAGNLAGLQGNVDADRADRQFREQDDLQRYLGDLGYKSDIYAADASKEATLGKAAYDYDGTVYKADRDLTGTVYKADSDYAGTVYKADSQLAGDKVAAYAKSLGSSGSGKSGGGSGGSGSGKSGGASDGSESEGKSYATTIPTLVSNALKAGEDEDGDYVYPEKSDAEIQRLLNDADYSDDAKEKLSDAYYEKTGRRIKFTSVNDRTYSQLLRRLTNQTDSDEKYKLVLSWMSHGTVDAKTAEKLLVAAGVNVGDLRE